MVWAALLLALGACTVGDGEGARYIGRVVSVTPARVCVGPSSSAPGTTCGAVPDGFDQLPTVGQCVGLSSTGGDVNGNVTERSRKSLSKSACHCVPVLKLVASTRPGGVSHGESRA